MLGPVLAVILFAADRALKTLALSAHDGSAFVFATTPPSSAWGFGATLNYGAVFGLPIPTPLVVAASILTMVAIIIFAWRHPQPLTVDGAAFICLGGFSNVLDRLKFGAVVDVFSAGLATFNLSDMMVIFGALLILQSLRHSSSPKNEKP